MPRKPQVLFYTTLKEKPFAGATISGLSSEICWIIDYLYRAGASGLLWFFLWTQGERKNGSRRLPGQFLA